MKYFLLLLCWGGSHLAMAQSALDFSYNYPATGKNIGLAWQYISPSRWSYGAGLGYHLNNKGGLPDGRGYGFRHRFEAKTLREHLVLRGQVAYTYYGRTTPVQLFAQLNGQLARMGIKNIVKQPIAQIDTTILYAIYPVYWSPMTTLEVSLTTGVHAQIHPRVYIRAHTGIGIQFLGKLPTGVFLGRNWDPAPFPIHLSLGYMLHKVEMGK